MADTYSIDLVRAKIKTLFEQHPNVHVNVFLTHPKLNIQNVEIKIVGVYPHIFQIEEYTEGKPKRHTLQYTDVVLNNIEISELKQC